MYKSIELLGIMFLNNRFVVWRVLFSTNIRLYSDEEGGCYAQRCLPNSSGDTEEMCFYIWGWRASFRRADAAQVCSNVGFVEVDGVFECSVAKAARQIVSERW